MFSHERGIKDSKLTVQALPWPCERPPMNGGHPFQDFDIVWMCPPNSYVEKTIFCVLRLFRMQSAFRLKLCICIQLVDVKEVMGNAWKAFTSCDLGMVHCFYCYALSELSCVVMANYKGASSLGRSSEVSLSQSVVRLIVIYYRMFGGCRNGSVV